MTENGLAIHKDTSIIHSFADAERAAIAMAKSGYFQDSRDASQAIVKILAGQELGFGPFSSMTGVNIIQNKPVLAANLMAAAVKRTGKYNYRVKELTDDACELVFFESGQEVGKSKFTMADAKAAGLDMKDNWKKYKRNMLFARALSNGQKWYAPDIFNGATVYTPDELGADVDDEGNVIPGSFQEVAPQSVPESKPEIKSTPVPTAERPYSPEALKDRLQVLADSFAGKTCTDGDRTSVRLNLKAMAGGEDEYHLLLHWLTGASHIADVQPNEILAIKKWIGVKKQEDDSWIADSMSIKEAKTAFTEALKDAGQLSMDLPADDNGG